MTRRRYLVQFLALVSLLGPAPALAQLPGLPAAPKPASPPKEDPTKHPVAAKGEPGSVFTATSGTIKVDSKVDDAAIKSTLSDLLAEFPGVISVQVEAKDGVVKLAGHVDDDDTMDDVTAFAQKVEGVRLVLNKMKTDAEILSGRQKAAKVLADYGSIVARNWLLALIALGFMMGSIFLAREFNNYSEALLSPFLGNSLLRSVASSVLSTAIVLGGILLGLSVLNLTHAVLSILGLAGVAGLALGFAFRDIAENFIASMLLGVRRPFGIGDFITVAGKSGSVLSLNTRATILITPEGNRVQIPNAVIYKETLVNASTSPSTLGAIDVTIPYDSSTAAVLESIAETLRSADGLLQDPPPRALVQSLEADGVKVRATYWMPSRGIDVDKLQSDLRLRVKVAIAQAGGTPPPVAAAAAAPLAEATPSGEAPAPIAQQVQEENLRKDARAAEAVAPAEPQATPIDHAIRQAQAEAITEGGNMLVNGKA